MSKDFGPGTAENPLPQYATDAEVEDLVGGGSSVSDAIDAHEAASNPHPAYDTDTDTQDLIDTSVTAHEGDADPHTVYAKDSDVSDAVDVHEAASDPHPGYASNADIGAAVTDHVAGSDPHPTYETSTEAASKVSTHAAVTTSVHGISNTASLETTSGATTKVSNHAAAADPHGDRAYADSVASGLDIKASVQAATTANITLSGAQTIDGVSVVAGNRVLVKNQSTTKDNGIYVAASGAWARSSDADTTGELSAGAFAYVEGGTVNGGSSFACSSAGTLGTDPVVFTQFNQAGTVSAGAGLTKTGSTIDVVSADSSLTVAADSVIVAANHGGSTHATATTNATNVSFPVVRPETYGAVGDGSNDDTSAVQAAIDAIPSTGGTLALAPGAVYKLVPAVTAKTITAATYASSPETVTFTTSATHGVVAQDFVNVTGVSPTAYNQTYLVKSVSAGSKTITCYADHKSNPGTYVSGGTVTGTALYVRDKAGLIVRGAAARSQSSSAGGSWFKLGSAGMVLFAAQKTTTGAITHSAPTFKDVGFIDTAVDVNLQTSVSGSWSGGTITFTKTAHGFVNGDVVHVFNSATSGGQRNLDTTTSYPVTRVDADTFTAPLAVDPGGTSPTTCSVVYQTLPAANTPTGVGLIIGGATRCYVERCMFSGLRFGALLQTANSRDSSWGKFHACVWELNQVGFKILGDGGQSVYIDGGNLIMHTGQVGFQGPNPQEATNDINHFRCTGMKIDTHYTNGADCMAFDLGLCKYAYLAGHSFEMEGTPTTRCVRVGSAQGGHGTIVAMNCQHNDGGSGGVDATAIEILGTSTGNPASFTVMGGRYTNFATAIKIGPYAQGCQVIGGTHGTTSSNKKGISIDNPTNVIGTVIVGFSATRTTSGTYTLLDIPSGSDTRWIACWDYGGTSGTPKWYSDGLVQQKAGTPSTTAGTEFPVFHDGQSQLDTTNNRIYFRSGGAWHYATLT